VKYDHIRLLEKHLEASPQARAPIYCIVGKELHEIQEAIQLLIKTLTTSPLAVSTFDAGQLDESRLWMELDSLSFFVETRVIWIQQIDKLKKSVQEQLEKYLNRPSTSQHLIFSASTLSKQQALYQLADQKGIVLELPEIKLWEKEKKAVEWVTKQATAVRKVMAYPVCQLLVKQVGADYALLSQEMAKLVCYCEDKKEITTQDVQAICSVLHVESIFLLGEAIFQRNATQALQALHTLMTDGQAALPLIRQVRSQLQTTYQVALLLAQEHSTQDIVQEFPYMKGQILEKQIKYAQNYGLRALQEGLLIIDKTEYQLKNSLADPQLIMELLIIQLIRLI